MGGIHASLCSEEVLEHFDSVFIGEAEDLWGRVIEDAKVNNLKSVYKAPQRPDLSRLAIPRFDLLNFDNYVTPPFSKTPCLPIQTTRGCPNNCNFCSVTAFLGHKIRKKPISHIIKEIKTFNPSLIFFTDDNIGADPAYAKELFEAIRPLKLRWACQMSTTIGKHPELIELAAKAGCHETYIGIESISEESLKSVSKGFNKVDDYKDIFERLRKVGILGQASFVFGLDGDTVDSLERTIDTILSWDVKFIFIHILTPLPKTQIHQQMKTIGRILEKDWSLYDCLNPLIKFENLSSEELVNIIWKSYRKFYSLGNILKRTWRFKKEYVSFFPRDNVVEDVFFSLLIRNSVRKGKHPFTLGLEIEGNSLKKYKIEKEHLREEALVG